MKKIFWPMLMAVLLVMSACALLPTTEQTVQSPWNTFDDAKAAFDKIVPYETTADELRAVGFDPFSTPNIKIMTYLDIMNTFMPNPSIKKDDLDEGIQTCIAAKEECRAYRFEPKIIHSKRYGNVFLDLFNFKRKTRETGWQFSALVVLIDDTVVYKLWSGNPIINENIETKNPLGPLQNPTDAVKGAVPIVH